VSRVQCTGMWIAGSSPRLGTAPGASPRVGGRARGVSGPQQIRCPERSGSATLDPGGDSWGIHRFVRLFDRSTVRSVNQCAHSEVDRLARTSSLNESGFSWSSRSRAGLAGALMLAALVGCGGAAGQAGQSGHGGVHPAQPAGHTPAAATTGSPGQASHTQADVDFMQGMIAHHAQAIVMTGLVAGRSSRPDVQLLARRIDISQAEEIEIMQRWLAERGEEVPGTDDPHAHHGGHHGHENLMPGMLSEEELARLAASRGPEFDRLFLEYMIRHHEGALVMVQELFAAGGGQDSEMFQFASHVDGDQRIEIARMHRMLGQM
jgi:uncharacterized protein (DUF305 family)